MKTTVIFEMANNHGGSVDHGKFIIDNMARVKDIFQHAFSFAFKFQMRNYETFIHAKAREEKINKYVDRFLNTELSLEDFSTLKEYAESKGFFTICTPFDEESVDKMVKLGFKHVKIASCSCGDWPLMNKIVSADFEQIYISTAGADCVKLSNISKFFQNRNIVPIVFHCIGEYPTPPEDSNLNQLKVLNSIFPYAKQVGLSSHESPEQTSVASIAYAMGARIFEKHVDEEQDGFKPNAYSCNSYQMAAWLDDLCHTMNAMGDEEDKRYTPTEKEQSDLMQFKRGVFFNKDIKAGQIITPEDYYLAWPAQQGQLLAEHLEKYVHATTNIDSVNNAPVMLKDLYRVDYSHIVKNWVGAVIKTIKDVDLKFLLNMNASLELSHHYGIEQYRKTGMAMLTAINDVYCKKYLILLPGQTHPEQYHQKKQETFIVLGGEVIVDLDGKTFVCKYGDVITVQPGVKHRIRTWGQEWGAVLEEISTTHDPKDSFYTDPKIMENKARKTLVEHWTKWTKE